MRLLQPTKQRPKIKDLRKRRCQSLLCLPAWTNPSLKCPGNHLEKHCTYDRIRKGILSTDTGELKEVNVKDLNHQERRNLLERLIKVGEDDFEKFLLKLNNKVEKVGIELPTIEVRFEHLNIEAEAYVGSRGSPTVINFIFNMLEGLLSTLHILPSPCYQRNHQAS